MASLNSELIKTKQEIDRLLHNWRALLDSMPEIVILIRSDCVIEYMNPMAISTIGDLCGQACKNNLCVAEDCREERCPVRLSVNGKSYSDLVETRIGDVYVEYSFVPFQGYMGDRLVMLVMRDISERKQHELEIASFHSNIEEILQKKINDLDESESLRKDLSKQINHLKKQLKQSGQSDEMIGSCRKMRELRDMIYQVADSDATILICGESGTGKELVADLVRNNSHRRDKPFLKVNCNAINDNLLESDLFGYEKGAFTGASARKKGKFEIVDGGSIFLDEIGDISPRMQSALLRVLQNGEIIRVGGNTPVSVDVRVIAATNVDLAQAVQDGSFRLDLYYRLNIINILIPPLRERKEDVVELATHFVRHYRQAFKKSIDFLPDKIINRLLMHDWPGNVRELENVIQRAVLMAKNNIITEQDLYFDVNPTGNSKGNYFQELCEKVGDSSLKDVLGSFERDMILQFLQTNNGNVQKTASLLNVGKTALYDKIKRYGISVKMSKS